MTALVIEFHDGIGADGERPGDCLSDSSLQGYQEAAF